MGTGYIVCKPQCKMKMQGPYPKCITNFKMDSRAKPSMGPFCIQGPVPLHVFHPRSHMGGGESGSGMGTWGGE